MIGDASQRHPVPLAHLPGGQDNLQLLRGNLGVFVKGLVEITQAKEDNSPGILFLNPEVLLSDRGQTLFHLKSILLEFLAKRNKE
ncbi:hypothetical protein ES703_56565 [subsurface metagenome]